MPVFSGVVWNTVTAFSTGVILKCFANAMLKDRYWARPWNHLLLGTAFGYIGYNYDRWEGEMLALVNEKRVERGMKPVTREKLVPGLSK